MTHPMPAARPLPLLALLAGIAGACDASGGAHVVPFTGVLLTASVVTNASPLQPVIGGTLLVTRDDTHVVAADPDADAVFVVDLADPVAPGGTTRVALAAGDEPGRLVEDSDGRIHVALRRGGGLATIDPVHGTVTARVPVCPAPRGLAYDAARGVLFVACEDGTLATVSPSTGAVFGVRHLADDLRDVVVGSDGRVLVSRFRSAQVLVVDPDAPNSPVVAMSPATFDRTAGDPDAPAGLFEPEVAWRMVADARGGAMMVYQRKIASSTDLSAPNVGAPAPVGSASGGYDSDDEGGDPVAESCPHTLIHAAMSHVDDARGVESSPMLPPAFALPVDVAVNASQLAVASAQGVDGSASGTVTLFDASMLAFGRPCMDSNDAATMPTTGRPVAVAFTHASNQLVYQTRGPATLVVLDATNAAQVLSVPLGTAQREDTGAALFHDGLTPMRERNTTLAAGGIACASCHPEGGDDGQVWSFDGRPVRTLSLRGGVMANAPFHWDGRFATFADLAEETYAFRMHSAVPDAPGLTALGRWVDAIPRAPAVQPGDLDAVARGDALFHDATTGCAGCHGGPRLSTHAVVDVGTGGAFKVPSLLGVASHGPWMHNGCAASLAQRFEPACGGGEHHGHTAHLTPAQRADLVTYLQTL